MTLGAFSFPESNSLVTNTEAEFSILNFQPLVNRTWRMIHGSWGPEGSSVDSRQHTGHQNWGLAERKAKPVQANTRQSDYTVNYLGEYISF